MHITPLTPSDCYISVIVQKKVIKKLTFAAFTTVSTAVASALTDVEEADEVDIVGAPPPFPDASEDAFARDENFFFSLDKGIHLTWVVLTCLGS